MARANQMSLVLDNPNIPADVLFPREEDVERMIQVIEAESLLVQGNIVCAAAGHCALGTLLFATGIKNEELLDIGNTPTTFTAGAARRLYGWYRLDQSVAYQIMTANDDVSQRGREFHGDEDVVLANANHLYVPTESELLERKRLVINRIRGATNNQRAIKKPSWWNQLPELAQYDPRAPLGTQSDDYASIVEEPQVVLHAMVGL
jgi:hypothetical protein